jgi:hypothetical protein
VEFLHLPYDVGRVQIDKAERNNSRRILLGRFGDHLTVGIWSEHARRHIQPLAHFHKIGNEIRVLFIEVNVHVDNAMRHLV